MGSTQILITLRILMTKLGVDSKAHFRVEWLLLYSEIMNRFWLKLVT